MLLSVVLSTLYLPEVDLRGYPVDAVVTEYDGLGELEVGSPGRGVEVVMVLVMAVLRNTTVSTRAGAAARTCPPSPGS